MTTFFLPFQHEQKSFVRSQPYFGTNPPNDACFGTSKSIRKCHLYPTSCKWSGNVRCYFWRESLQDVSSTFVHVCIGIQIHLGNFLSISTLVLLWQNREIQTFWWWKLSHFQIWNCQLATSTIFETGGFFFLFKK